MKKLMALSAVIVLALSIVGAAVAITNGVRDGSDHPNVGAFLVQRPSGWRVLCTGALVAPRVFLTASHCTSYAEANGWTVGVTFQSTDAEHPTTVLSGHAVTNPLYHAPYQHDVSIILLDQPQPGPYVGLPAVGLLDDLKKAGSLDASDFVNVGYGTHEAVNGPGGLDFPFDGDRWKSVSSYSALNKDVIHLHQKDNRDEGGTGYGDSGGPTLLNGMAIAVVSTGDVPCWSTSVNTRTDTQEAADFLRPYLALTQ
jgi:secreted trypsin-like serine protease